jgi:hypothetical protein
MNSLGHWARAMKHLLIYPTSVILSNSLHRSTADAIVDGNDYHICEQCMPLCTHPKMFTSTLVDGDST